MVFDRVVKAPLIRPVVLLSVLVLVLAAGSASTHPAPVQAQGGECPALYERAMQIIGSACANMGANEACYGHTLVTATFQPGASGVRFDASGDVANLTDLQALVSRPADPASDTWGIAMMKVQADLPDGSGNAMTFVLVGDSEIHNAATSGGLPTCAATNGPGNVNMRSGPGTTYGVLDVLPRGAVVLANGTNTARDWLRLEYEGTVGWVSASLLTLDCDIQNLMAVEPGADVTVRPMQVFTLANSPNSPCEEAPNGLLVHSPTGERTHIMVNGVQLEFASDGFMTAVPDQSLDISGITGEIKATAAGKTVTLLPGITTSIPLAGLQASGPPSDPFEIGPRYDVYRRLATDALPQVTVAAEPCTVSTNGNVEVRVGPGTNRGNLGSLRTGQSFTVLGWAEANDGTKWWKIDLPGTAQAWVARDEVDERGDCRLEVVPSADVPPLIIKPHSEPPPQQDTSGGYEGDAYIYFGADRTSIRPGECATVQWDVENIQAVFYEGAGVTGHETRRVCPLTTTTYTLTVQLTDGSSTRRTVTINVGEQLQDTTTTGEAYIAFWADDTSLNSGECTTLYWSTENIDTVEFQDAPVNGDGQRQVCPSGTTTYSLRVRRRDGVIDTRYITINVGGSTVSAYTASYYASFEVYNVTYYGSMSCSTSITGYAYEDIASGYMMYHAPGPNLYVYISDYDSICGSW
ncbi:MAG: SH3 domain-containing protein [Anaerolineae bacterium]|nr:SH3 domain-containing protein [Anaerolineae bacterium]